MKNEKKVPPKFKELIRKACQRHAWNMEVTHFQLDIKYMGEDKESFENGVKFVTRASMDTDLRYLRGTLKIYPALEKEWKVQGDDFVDRIIAHEVAHLVTEHLYSVGTATYRDQGEMEDARESCTERIGRMSVALDKLLKKK